MIPHYADIFGQVQVMQLYSEAVLVTPETLQNLG